jgi:hypothetical protein
MGTVLNACSCTEDENGKYESKGELQVDSKTDISKLAYRAIEANNHINLRASS